VRGNTITQLTTDHTWIQEAIDYGALTAEQARKHPNAHVIRRYLGSPNPPEPDFRLRLRADETILQSEANQGLQLLTGDMILLCSDGLSDLVNQEEIKEALKSQPREKALDSLIDLANQRGGHDNITAIVMEVPGGMEKTRISQARPRRRRRVMLSLVLVALATFLIIGATLAAAGFYRYATQPTSLPTHTVILTATSTPLPPSIIPTETLIPATETQPAPTRTQGVQATLTPWPTNTLLPSAP
jgi:protein phosphatase